jgi:radical SAM superfamily enzyme YgiQ (UPF0313 family)
MALESNRGARCSGSPAGIAVPQTFRRSFQIPGKGNGSCRHALCVYPYRGDPSEVGLLPPIGLELIASVLEPTCDSVEIVDLRMRAGRTIDFCRPDTDLVCFSVNWEREIDFVREEVRSVPAGIFVLLGGRHVTEDPAEWLRSCPNVSAIVRGDGEEAVASICRGDALESIGGLSFRKDGSEFHNPAAAPGPLRDDCIPARGLRHKAYQLGYKGVRTGIPMDLISSSRGCPFNCTFCSFNRNPWGKKREWSARSPESVVDEVARVEAPLIGFTDDLFTFDLDRVERICDLIVARKIRKKFIVNARLEVARRPDVLRKMERAGFFLLLLGVESAQDKTLRAMRKGFDTARIREWFKVLRRTNMILHGYFILGCIGESREEMLQIGPFARELGLDTIALSALRNSRHSGLEELVASTPGYHISESGKVYSDACSSNELRELRRRIYREFFTVPRFLRMVRKGVRLGALAFLPRVLPRIPTLCWNEIKTNRKKARHRRVRRRAAYGLEGIPEGVTDVRSGS